MTAPRQEPSTKRDITGLGWGERQLARRPAPTGAWVVDWAVATGDTDEVVANDTVKNIPYDSVDIPTNSTHFAVGPSNIKPITIILDGWYMIYVEAWMNQAVGDSGVGITKSGAGYFYNFSYNAGGLFARRINYHKNGSIQWGFQETFGPVYCVSKHQCHVGAVVYHSLDTPSSEDWNWMNLVIVNIGPGLDLTDTAGGDWTPAGENGDEQFRTYF